MRKLVLFPGKRYYSMAPLMALGYMLLIVVLTIAGFSKAVSVVTVDNRVVIIDPGHGGYDPGAISSQGVYEKNINLAISKKIRSQLEPAGAKVILTREDDRDFASGVRGGKSKKQTDLDHRIGLAEGADAEVFVSIHVNATPGGRKSGAETFYNEGSDEGKVLAESIQVELRQVPGMNKRVAKPGGYYITQKTKMTSVIVELGYLTNPIERKKLQQEAYQDELAKAISRGVLRYLERRP